MVRPQIQGGLEPPGQVQVASELSAEAPRTGALQAREAGPFKAGFLFSLQPRRLALMPQPYTALHTLSGLIPL